MPNRKDETPTEPDAAKLDPAELDDAALDAASGGQQQGRMMIDADLNEATSISRSKPRTGNITIWDYERQ